MTIRYNQPSGNMYSQQQQYQQGYNQAYYQQPTWYPVFQPLMVYPQAFAMPQQPYGPSPSCPSLYSLQQKPAAYHHMQQRLVPAQVASLHPSPVDYRQHPTLQAPFQQHPSPWYGHNHWQHQQYSAAPLPPLQYPDENASYSQYQAPSQSAQIYHESATDYQYPDQAYDPLKDLKLIPSSASNIPPHPSIENSAVPLAEFAVELIWEICMSAKDQAIAMRDSRQQSNQNTAPSTPGQYGTIGGERAAHRAKSSHSPASLEELYFNGSHSYLSSPESPAGPVTPPSSTLSTACPIPVQFQNGKAEFMQGPTEQAPWLRDTNSTNSATTCNSPKHDLSIPSASVNFRRFVQDLLKATLVTPQVLLLSMLYVARIPQATEDGGWNKFLTKGSPYKMILGSLICANKHLDDNSFRCSTWATVSACPIADVTQAESMVLRALNFDLNVSPQEWSSWLQVLVERRARQNPSVEDCVLGRFCSLVDEVELQM